jgi:hypothetical protein
LKNVGTPECLDGDVESLGDLWMNQALILAIFARTYIKNVIPKFKSLFGKELKPIKTPIIEGHLTA